MRALSCAGRRAGRRTAHRVAAPRRALHREAGDAGYLGRRPDRRRRSGQGRSGPHSRRSGDGALRTGAAHQPRRVRPQRAARSGRAHPGRPVQCVGGARHPGTRLLAAAASGRLSHRHGQPRGLHQPGPHHHPAEGPLRRRDPHPLPHRARRRGELIRQEATLVAEVGDHLLEVLARFVRNLRESSSVDQRSGVSARFAIAAAEGVAGSALAPRRAYR